MKLRLRRIIAPGTGLGESFLAWDGSRHVSYSSGGGHADFAPTNDRQIGLLKYMLKRFDHVSVKLVCSGIGIPYIYEYLRDIEQIPENAEIAELMVTTADRTAAITNSTFDEHNPSELCRVTVDTFVSILASEAASMALKVMATGGIYLRAVFPYTCARAAEESRFIDSFLRKGRFAKLIERIPVHVILNRAALVGSAAYGLASFKEES
jgi:glucokinase